MRILRAPGAVRRPFAAALLAIAGAGAGLRAEIQWQERRILLQPPAGAKDATGEFVFTNRGSTPVRVVESRSGCECTVLARNDTVVYPGQQGRLPVVFHLEGRSGRQAVSVIVTTSEPEIRHHELTVEVEIAEFATVTPRVLFWKVGDEALPKILHVHLREGFRLESATSATPEFAVEVVQQAGLVAQLRVTPRDTWAKRSGQIQIRILPDGKSAIELLVPVRVI